MAGYCGWSMSNNAVKAYEDGEMPISKWTKKEIVGRIEDVVENGEIELQCSMEKLKKLPLRILKTYCLILTSWHHTSKFYNETGFYSLNVSYIEKLTDEDLERLGSNYKGQQKKSGLEGGAENPEKKEGSSLGSVGISESQEQERIHKEESEWEQTVHDGVSPIKVPEEYNEREAFDMLWDYLIPMCGKAPTAQGEIIRIVGRVKHEYYGNGCDNWDKDFQKMLDAFPKYLRLGNGLGKENLKVAEDFVQRVKKYGEDSISDEMLQTFSEYAVAWVKQNPEVIESLKADYGR